MLKKEIKRCLAIIMAVALSAACIINAYTVHQVKKGDTLWGISNKYNVSIEKLTELNPSLSGGLKPGMKVKIPDPTPAQSESPSPAPTPAAPTPSQDLPQAPATTPASAVTEQTPVSDVHGNNNYYVSAFGDSFRNISRKTGVSIDSLRRYNPFVDENTIAEGTIIRLNGSPLIFTDARPLTLVDSIEYMILPEGAKKNVAKSDIQAIVLVLPFGNNNASLNRQNHLATEFYKGFLLSAQKNQSMTELPPVRIIALEAPEKAEDIAGVLDNLDLGTNTIIIPADDEALITAIGKYAVDNGQLVLNSLSIKDTSYTNNPNVIQCNINQAMMYDRAISYIAKEYADYIPVVLKPASGASEKANFVDALKVQYTSLGVEPIELSYGKTLAEKDLKKLKKNTKYIFIPQSGSADVFASFAPALSKYFADNNDAGQLRLFGYPDWVILTDDNAKALHDMNGMIYSRFFVDNEDMFTKQMQDEFTKWYGTPMVKAFPVQAILGYDTANLIFRMLRKSWVKNEIDKFANSSYTGEQSSFHFVHDNDSKGYINDALYIVEYLPGESYYVKVIAD